VRLSVRNRQIEGSTADIDVGTVKLADGEARSVKLTKPVFVVAPSGSYRASADLSIGGGILGQINMGQARASVVATNREIQFNNFTADVFDGRASGNARDSRWRKARARRSTRVSTTSTSPAVGCVVASAVPLTGRATGRVDLTFPGTDVKLATGTITTQLSAEQAKPAPTGSRSRAQSPCVPTAVCSIFSR
jgi:hypothetical protein